MLIVCLLLALVLAGKSYQADLQNIDWDTTSILAAGTFVVDGFEMLQWERSPQRRMFEETMQAKILRKNYPRHYVSSKQMIYLASALRDRYSELVRDESNFLRCPVLTRSYRNIFFHQYFYKDHYELQENNLEAARPMFFEEGQKQVPLKNLQLKTTLPEGANYHSKYLFNYKLSSVSGVLYHFDFMSFAGTCVDLNYFITCGDEDRKAEYGWLKKFPDLNRKAREVARTFPGINFKQLDLSKVREIIRFLEINKAINHTTALHDGHALYDYFANISRGFHYLSNSGYAKKLANLTMTETLKYLLENFKNPSHPKAKPLTIFVDLEENQFSTYLRYILGEIPGHCFDRPDVGCPKPLASGQVFSIELLKINNLEKKVCFFLDGRLHPIQPFEKDVKGTVSNSCMTLGNFSKLVKKRTMNTTADSICQIGVESRTFIPPTMRPIFILIVSFFVLFLVATIFVFLYFTGLLSPNCSSVAKRSSINHRGTIGEEGYQSDNSSAFVKYC